jgi:hypothetical protein
MKLLAKRIQENVKKRAKSRYAQRLHRGHDDSHRATMGMT